MGQHLPHFLLCCIWPDAQRPVSCVAIQVLDLSVSTDQNVRAIEPSRSLCQLPREWIDMHEMCPACTCDHGSLLSTGCTITK